MVVGFRRREVRSGCGCEMQEEGGDKEGFNTSDEEFERQLEEAAQIEEQERVDRSAARKVKVKKGKGKNVSRKAKVKRVSPGDPDAEGYEVCCVYICHWHFMIDLSDAFASVIGTARLTCLMTLWLSLAPRD